MLYDWLLKEGANFIFWYNGTALLGEPLPTHPN